MLKPTSNGPIPPASPTKQLILRLAGELARLHDSQSSTLDLITEARTYLAQPEPQGPTDWDRCHLPPSVIDAKCATNSLSSPPSWRDYEPNL